MESAVLVLRRKAGEAIVIGDGVEISIIEISPSRVKLGILAPREVTVVRKEALAIAIENRNAAQLISAAGNCSLTEIARTLSKGFAFTADKSCEADTPGIAK